jgi:dihydroorotase
VMRALQVVTCGPAQVLGAALGTLQASAGQINVGGMADLCIIDPQVGWQVLPETLRSQGKHTPFAMDASGTALNARVRATLVGGHLAYESHS